MINYKRLFFLLFLFLFYMLGATNDELESYYKDCLKLTGNQLKKALHKKISDHKVWPYFKRDGIDGVGEILSVIDRDNVKPDNIMLFYTNRSQNVDFTDLGAKFDYSKYFSDIHNNSWNREHIWPKSHGFPVKGDTAYTDIHHIRPADRSVNGDRGTRDFDWGGMKNIEAEGTFSDFDSWEPRDDIKGDIARVLFYMAVRYEEDGDYDLELVDYTNTSGTNLGKLSTLLEWNILDPVSEEEKKRNELIFKNYQHNRNPFIDYPEFAFKIWGKPNKSPVLNPYEKKISFGNVIIGQLSNPVKYIVQGYNLKNKVEVILPENFYFLDNNKLENNLLSFKNVTSLNEEIEIIFKPENIKVYYGDIIIRSGKNKTKVPINGRGITENTKNIFYETFESLKNWEIYNINGKSSWVLGSYGSNYFAKIKNFKESKINKSWLVSSKIRSNYKNIILEFESAVNKKDKNSKLEIFYTKNFTGNPITTNWIKLNAKFSDENWNWINSGYLNIKSNEYFRLGFLFSSKNSKERVTWEIDNVIIIGEKNK